MGPFVPDVFSQELNYIIAIFIGFVFGFSLEQAGFSSSRKIAGLFFGYDFTVLKVFFTAAITAMIGIIFLDYFGYLDIDVIFVNPLFWPSAIVGGLIMGLGMVIGGYCPGTSVCASVIGKIDAWAFVLGVALGIFFFIISYPAVVSFYKAGYLGAPFVYDSIGMSRGLFVFLLVLIAIGAFVFGNSLEMKLRGLSEHPEKIYYGKYYAAATVAAILAFFTIFMPTWKTEILDEAKENAVEKADQIKWATADEAAFRVMHNDKNYQLIDVRSPQEFKTFNIPSAINIPISDILNPEWRDYFKTNSKSFIFYGDGENDAKLAYFVGEELGRRYDKVMKNGINYFKRTILNVDNNLPDTTTLQGKFDYRFRTRAKLAMKELKAKYAARKAPKKKRVIRVAGGC